ncbi:MAG: hypothetical protein QGH93_12560 [Gammaproteobacteria bacterium]|jgi:hypothetical protein|nr:hypothetical protein [Gammaproteobacteria bacterium]
MNRFIKSPLLPASLILLSTIASADKLTLPPGMGGVPDIGTIPCEVFNKMIVVGPLGTKRLLLTWAEGYYRAKTGKTFDEILQDAETAGQSWDFDSLTGHFVDYCAADPEAPTAAAVVDLGERLLNISR